MKRILSKGCACLLLLLCAALLAACAEALPTETEESTALPETTAEISTEEATDMPTETTAIDISRETTVLMGVVLSYDGTELVIHPTTAADAELAYSFVPEETPSLFFAPGDLVEVTCRLPMQSAYPSDAVSVRRIGGDWVAKDETARTEMTSLDRVTILEIQEDCFYASALLVSPFQILFHGSLPEEYCVGDVLSVSFSDAYSDETTHRIEANFESVGTPIGTRPGEIVCYKPVIYLYPEATTDVFVRLTTDGALTCTYPAYGDGWRVTASPDGTLTDSAGQTYNYLYWEGTTGAEFDFSRGFCVAGCDTASFLEGALASLGLTRREANEMIVFWLPLMQENPYNLISFQTKAYTDSAALSIDPSPDTLIRVFMAWKPLSQAVEIEPQTPEAPARVGFTVVEWGGAMVK